MHSASFSRHTIPFAALIFSIKLAGAALAGSQADLKIMTCGIGSKNLSITLLNDTVVYTFSSKRNVELEINESLTSVLYEPWDGFGRYVHDRVSFQNGRYSYAVYTSYDKFQEATGWIAGVNVFKNGKFLAQFNCNEPFNNNPLDKLFIAKEKSGQCWDLESQSWHDFCQPSPSVE